MPSMRSQFVFSLIAVILVLLPAMMWGQTAPTPGSAAEVVPVAKAQAPSAKLDVTYVNSQLTIKASKAPLIEVLRAACTQIGAELDAQVQPEDPVSGTLGPATAKDVLKALLSDAHVNYVLGATSTDPNAIANVTISRRTEDTSASSQVVPEQTDQAQDTSATNGPVKSGASQMMELIEAAKGELANGSVNLDQIDNGAGSAGGGAQANLATVVQQIEQQMKSAEQTASDTSQTQQTDSAPATDTNAQRDIVHPTHRPMHRKHH